MTRIALVREVSPQISSCELTHLDRTPIDAARAAVQHETYVAALAGVGCSVRWLPAAPELPDSVFVEDTAVVLDELAVITRPGAESRRAEVTAVAVALEEFRTVHYIRDPGTLDGGDVLQVGRILYVGQTPRTNPSGTAQLGTIVAAAGYEVRPVPVRGCLHLKSAVTALDVRILLINRDWTDPEAFRGYRLIDVDRAEPFGANALALNGTVIHASEFPRTSERIRNAGFPVRTVEASELAKAEGGVTCCSLIL